MPAAPRSSSVRYTDTSVLLTSLVYLPLKIDRLFYYTH